MLHVSKVLKNHTYRTLRPKTTNINTRREYVDDRIVVSINDGIVTYDSPDLQLKQKDPETCTIEDFCNWACLDITNNLPNMDWQDISKDTYETK